MACFHLGVAMASWTGVGSMRDQSVVEWSKTFGLKISALAWVIMWWVITTIKEIVKEETIGSEEEERGAMDIEADGCSMGKWANEEAENDKGFLEEMIGDKRGFNALSGLAYVLEIGCEWAVINGLGSVKHLSHRTRVKNLDHGRQMNDLVHRR